MALRFYDSCLAVKNMGIEIRDIRKKLVSNIVCCMEERLKNDSEVSLGYNVCIR